MNNIDTLINQYYSWLKDKTAWKSFDKWVEITAPYLDRNNDYIQIYLKETDDGYLLTDNGATIIGLQQEGCSLNGSNRQKLLSSTLAGYGVAKKENCLQVNTSLDNFAIRKHALIQAILAINDMFYLAESQVTNLFLDDVRNWLEISEIRYSESISFIGKSGYPRKFDFLIPKSRQHPERIIKTINNPRRNNIDSVTMDWFDTKKVRPENSKAYAVINDNQLDISSVALGALRSYNIKPVLWNNRDGYRDELAA